MARFSKKNDDKAGRGYPYWIIMNRKTQRVWIGDRDTVMFATEEEARKEFNIQKAALKPGMKTDYAVERVDGPKGKKYASGPVKQEEQGEVDELEEMARQSNLPYKD